MATKEIRIVTNNPRIERGVALPYEIIFVKGTPIDVLDRTQDLLQEGWRLLSAPLPPNVPMMRGPYRSLLIEKNEFQYDKGGLISIDKARVRYIMERENHKLPEANEDFAIIDRQMLQRMIRDTMIIKSAEKDDELSV